MNIGLVSFTDPEYGLDLAYALHNTGERVHLYLSKHQAFNFLGANTKEVESFYKFGLLPRDVTLHLFDAPRMRDLHSITVMQNLSQTIKNDCIDVAYILVGSGEIWLAVLAWLLRRLPVCSSMIIPKPNIGDKPAAPVVVAVNQLLAWNSDMIIVNGMNQVAYTQEKYNLSESQVHHISLPPRETTARWPLKQAAEESGLVLFIGRVEPHKGAEYLVRAQPLITKSVKNARIAIAGRGQNFELCRQQIQDPSRFELYEGFVSIEQAHELFQRACIVVLPYLTASASGILSTAQAFGKPVVATRVGALSEYVVDGVTGLLVPPADEEKLAEAIVKLLQNDKLRHQMGQNALEQVKEKREECIRRTIEVLEMSIAKHRMKSDKGWGSPNK